MSTFSYIARNRTGQRVEGTLAAASEQAVLVELQARDLAPVEVAEVSERRGGRRVPGRHLATAYRQLADLLRAGVPLLRALRLLGRGKASPNLSAVMSKVADAVADGERLADAMSAHPKTFPEIQVAMVQAGERGGFLESVLTRMGEYLNHQAEVRAKILGSLVYPVVLSVVCTAVVVFALVFFVPKFEPFYARMDTPLPTRIVLGLSAVLVKGGWMIAVALVLAAFGAHKLLQRPAWRRRVAVGQMRIPRLGGLISSVAVARSARVLGTLLQNGVPMLPAMKISRAAAGHPLLEETIDQAIEAVRAGESLAQPFERSGLIGEDVVEMISVGETANNLAPVLLGIAEAIESRVDRRLTLAVRLLEPAMLFVLGGMVMFIFIALVVPMMQMSSALAQ